jgi:hypothetical protein
MGALKPICVKCQRFYRPHRNARMFVEGMPKVFHARPGTDHPEDWKPYKVWNGDEWICHGCGSLIIVGVGGPIKERHQDGFDKALLASASYLQVNDC